MRKEQHAIYSSGKLEPPQGPNTSKLWDAEEESCSLQERQAHFEPVKWLQWDPRKKNTLPCKDGGGDQKGMGSQRP